MLVSFILSDKRQKKQVCPRKPSPRSFEAWSAVNTFTPTSVSLPFFRSICLLCLPSPPISFLVPFLLLFSVFPFLFGCYFDSSLLPFIALLALLCRHLPFAHLSLFAAGLPSCTIISCNCTGRCWVTISPQNGDEARPDGPTQERGMWGMPSFRLAVGRMRFARIWASLDRAINLCSYMSTATCTHFWSFLTVWVWPRHVPAPRHPVPVSCLRHGQKPAFASSVPAALLLTMLLSEQEGLGVLLMHV